MSSVASQNHKEHQITNNNKTTMRNSTFLLVVSSFMLFLALVTCSDSTLTPSLVKFIVNVRDKNTSDPDVQQLHQLMKSCDHCPSCTACLQCCMMNRIMNSKHLDQIQDALLMLSENVEWNCPCTACPTQCAMRSLVAQTLKESNYNEFVNHLNVSYTCSSSSTPMQQLECTIKKLLDKYIQQVKSSNTRVIDDSSVGTFIDKVANCPCTACPLQCGFRKLLSAKFE